MKTLDEIFASYEMKAIYPRTERQLQCLAVTEFIKRKEKEGARVVSGHVLRIILSDGREVPVLDGYVRYKMPDSNNISYYFQFDSNPFLPVWASREKYEGGYRLSTGLTEVYSIVWDGVNAWALDNLEQLVDNIEKAMEYASDLDYKFKDKYVPYRDKMEQTIYNY